MQKLIILILWERCGGVYQYIEFTDKADLLKKLMSVIRFPKWIVEAINSQMYKFLWNDLEGNHKYHLSNWQSLAQRKELGAWGFLTWECLICVF
jgi:hypothetical protein